jgi:hypothetical protein
LLLTLGLAACEPVDDPQYRYGVQLAELEFVLSNTEMGIHPDTSVLTDPNNPFSGGVTLETKFAVLVDGPIAGFYAWASSLASVPTGEDQFYTAVNLHGIYEEELAEPGDLPFVRDMAIRAYQSTLDNFPGAVTYDATGRLAFQLAPLCILGIESLGGVVENGWFVVEAEDGELIAVQNQ